MAHLHIYEGESRPSAYLYFPMGLWDRKLSSKLCEMEKLYLFLAGPASVCTYGVDLRLPQ